MLVKGVSKGRGLRERTVRRLTARGWFSSERGWLTYKEAARQKLLDGEVSELPKYEETLEIGYPRLRWLFRALVPSRLQTVVRLGSMQGWFYISMVRLAATGQPSSSGGRGSQPFLDFVRNTWREGRLARGMVGGDCAGTVKKRPRD